MAGRLHPVAVGLAALLVLVTGPWRARAEAEPDAESDPRLVVLNVPGGGTDSLRSQLVSIEGIALETQEWFVDAIKRHDLSPNGIMTDRERLRTVMQKSDIDYLLYLEPDEDHYTAKLLEGPEVAAVVELEVERVDGGLPSSGAETVCEQMTAFFSSEDVGGTVMIEDSTGETSEDEETSGGEETSEGEAGSGDGAAAARSGTESESREAGHLDGPVVWWATARGRLFRRNFTVAGVGNALLTYTSGFYPGFELEVEVFPVAGAESLSAPLGIYATYNHGFETLPGSPGGEGTPTGAISATHLESEVGLAARLGGRLPAGPLGSISRLRLSVGGHLAWFVVEANDQLPTTSTVSAALGGRLTEQLVGDRLAVRAGLKLFPFTTFLKGGGLFGDSSYTNGFAARLGLLYAISDHVGLVGGYRFRLHHSRFRGQGASGFRNAEAFELVQGIDVGIQYGQ